MAIALGPSPGIACWAINTSLSSNTRLQGTIPLQSASVICASALPESAAQPITAAEICAGKEPVRRSITSFRFSLAFSMPMALKLIPFPSAVAATVPFASVSTAFVFDPPPSMPK